MSEMRWWTRATMLAVMVVVVTMMVSVGGVAGSPQRRRSDSRDPVFNIWEFAISNDNYNPRRAANNNQDACTWAIARCCLVPNTTIDGAISPDREECFRNSGCPGAWFNDLCSKKFKGLVHGVIEDAFPRGF